MKKVKTVRINKKELSMIENSNKDLEIDDLIISDALNFADIFYLENIKIFINKKIPNICQYIIRNFDKEQLEPYLEELINVIADSDNYNVMIDLLNFNEVQIKDIDKKPLKDFKKQESIMKQKIVKSEDPMIYLRSAIYYYGHRWKYSSLNFKDRYKIENIILSYDFKKFNLDFSMNILYNDTQEPFTYFELLLIYCRDYSKNDPWIEAEQKVFKFVPVYMNRYIEEVIKTRETRIEDILLEMNVPELYFNYAKNNLQRAWEDFRDDEDLKNGYFPMKDKLIDAAINSIATLPILSIEYAELFTKRLSPEMENKMFIELNKKINYYNNNYFNLEDVLEIYLYIRTFSNKESFPLLENFLIKLNDLRDGLKLDEPYEDVNDFNEVIEFKKLLDEIIYNYILTNRSNKVWKEIGIFNKSDLLKLRAKIVDNGNYHTHPSGHGELDY